MAAAQTYFLKIYGTVLAQFQFEKTLGGFRARNFEIVPETAHLLSLNIMQVANTERVEETVLIPFQSSQHLFLKM